MKRSGGDWRRDIAIVIDGSMSMTIKVNGKSNFDRAIEEAVQLVETSDGDKSFSLVLGGPAASVRIPSPVSSRDDVLAALDSLTPLNGGLSVLDVLSSALMTLARGANPEKQIVLFTDSQKTGWETDSPAHWRMFARNMSFFAVRPVLMARVFDLPDEYRNIAVGEVGISRSVVGTDREVGIDVRIENTGREAVTPARLTLLSGGTEAGVYIPGQILPGASEQAHFRHRFKESGANRLSAVLECEDDLMCDNTRHLAVNVARNINVLLIDGNPSARFIERSAGFASLALAPGNDMLFQGGETGEGDHRFLVHPVIVDAVDAVSITNLDEYAVVVLADVPRLPSGFSAVLANYIRDGGGLLVAPGARALPAFYNSWKTGSGIPVTPAYMLERIACGTNGLSATPSTSTFTHSVLKDVASGMRSDMGTTSLDAYWKLQEEPADHSVAVGGRLNTGDIFACERNLGLGRVIKT